MAADMTLRDLVNQALDRHNATSGSELARLAKNNGYSIVHTTINHLRAGTYRSRPGRETLRAIAWLAGVPERVAYTAAGQPIPGKPFAEELPPNADLMSPEERDLVIRTIRMILKRYEDDSDPPPSVSAGATNRTGGQLSGTESTTNGEIGNDWVTLELRNREP